MKQKSYTHYPYKIYCALWLCLWENPGETHSSKDWKGVQGAGEWIQKGRLKFNYCKRNGQWVKSGAKLFDQTQLAAQLCWFLAGVRIGLFFKVYIERRVLYIIYSIMMEGLLSGRGAEKSLKATIIGLLFAVVVLRENRCRWAPICRHFILKAHYRSFQWAQQSNLTQLHGNRDNGFCL